MKRRLTRIYWVTSCCALLLAALAVCLHAAVRLAEIRESLRSILYTASAWTEESTAELHTLAHRIAGAAPPLRVTFINQDGLVVADSAVEHLQMDNHLDRPEVAQAFAGELGEDLRFSRSTGTYTLYAAVAVVPRLVLRLSYPLHEFYHLFLGSSLVFIALFLALYALQRRMYGGLIRRLMGQMDSLVDLLEGRSDALPDTEPELQPAMRRIAYQAGRMRQDAALIRARLEERQRFIASASHQLKTPLTAIRGFGELLDAADTPQEAQSYRAAILEACQRMQGVVDSLLRLSRAEGPDPRPRVEVDLAALAREIRAALAPLAGPKGVSIAVEGELRLQAVEQDMWEILHNLMDNAVRYGKAGGRVQVTFFPQGFTVEDDGRGIAPEHLPHIFEEFYRASEGEGGTGLGLAIVRRLAMKYGGEASAESQLGRGSRFTLRFVREM